MTLVSVSSIRRDAEKAYILGSCVSGDGLLANSANSAKVELACRCHHIGSQAEQVVTVHSAQP